MSSKLSHKSPAPAKLGMQLPGHISSSWRLCALAQFAFFALVSLNTDLFFSSPRPLERQLKNEGQEKEGATKLHLCSKFPLAPVTPRAGLDLSSEKETSGFPATRSQGGVDRAHHGDSAAFLGHRPLCLPEAPTLACQFCETREQLQRPLLQMASKCDRHPFPAVRVPSVQR